MSGNNLQIGTWYHFWSTTVHQGVMDYGQLEFVVSESAPCVTGDGQSGQSEALPINLG